MDVNEVVIRLDGKICLVQHDRALHEVYATTVDRVVDTTAAGDPAAQRLSTTRGAEGHRLAGRVISIRER